VSDLQQMEEWLEKLLRKVKLLRTYGISESLTLPVDVVPKLKSFDNIIDQLFSRYSL
jgi:hypothetical protein